MADTIILLGNERPMEFFRTVTEDAADVARIRRAARDIDTVDVSKVDHADPENPDATVTRHVVEVKADRQDLGRRICTISIPDGWSDVEALAEVPRMWAQQSLAPPSFVESEDAHLAESVARLFRDDDHPVPVGRPADWEESA